MARPTIYSAELAERILLQLEAGKSLREICAADDMPSRATVTSWISGNRTGFASQYALAKEIGLDQLAEECLEIADAPLIGEEVITKADGGVEVRKGDMLGHRKLQIETRLKLLSKLAPKKYGDLQHIEHSGGVDIAAAVLAARRRVGWTPSDDQRGSGKFDTAPDPAPGGRAEESVSPTPTTADSTASAGIDIAAALIAARRRAGFGTSRDDGSDLA